MSDITVLTCTIPGREELLAQNIASVRGQTAPVHAHLISSDDGSRGAIAKYNQLASCVETRWMSILDDDNFMFTTHIETITPMLDQADVIYTYDAGHTVPNYDINGLSPLELIGTFSHTNPVDQSCAIRTNLFHEVGGYKEDSSKAMDHHLWYRLASIGARFLCIPEYTWIYGTRDNQTPWRWEPEHESVTQTCKYCHIPIAKSEGGWIHTVGWTNDGYTHRAGQAICEPDMQSTIARPNE